MFSSGTTGVAEGSEDGCSLGTGERVGVGEGFMTKVGFVFREGFAVGEGGKSCIGFEVSRIIELLRLAMEPATSIIWQ